jgi:uncharacterized membrane protein
MFDCKASQTFEERQVDGIQGCGNAFAYIYFVSFMLIVSLIFLNLFIAIILEGFAQSEQEQTIRINNEAVDAFVTTW